MNAWLKLVQERFHPVLYLPMILAFSLCNVLYFCRSESLDFELKRFFFVFLLAISFFFRMRLFDEIKDFDIDKKINPTRPLARGLLSVSQVRSGIAFLILFELVLANTMGVWSFLFHTLALAFSLLMFEEFFIGEFLRPHLTSYALTHTIVISILGLSLGAGFCNTANISWQSFLFLISHWMFFSLFEFARKTWAPAEERENVDSYSKIFTPRGAIGLSLVSGFVGVLLFTASIQNPLLAIFATHAKYIVTLYGVYVLCCLPALIHISKRTFSVFRQASQIYLLLQYVVVVLIFSLVGGQ